MARLSIFRCCCSSGQPGKGPPSSDKASDTKMLQLQGLLERQAKQNPGGGDGPSHRTPGPLPPAAQPPCLQPGEWAQRGGGGGTVRTAPPFGQALASCFLCTDGLHQSPFPREKSHHDVSTPWRSARLSQILTSSVGTIDALVRLLMTINSLSGSLLSKCH